MANPYTSLISQLTNQYNTNKANAQKLWEQQQKAAQDAYDKNLKALTDAYTSRTNSLKSNYDSSLSTLQNNYNASNQALNKSAEGNLQQAYLNYMNNQKNLGQILSAQGLSGGASESTAAKMLNSYGNNRNSIRSELADQLSTLQNNYDAQKASALEEYNSLLADDHLNRLNAEVNLRNTLASAVQGANDTYYGSLSDLENAYLSALADLKGKEAGYSSSGSSGTGSSRSSGSTSGESKTFSEMSQSDKKKTQKWKIAEYQVADMAKRGYTPARIASALMDQGFSDSDIASIMNSDTQYTPYNTSSSGYIYNQYLRGGSA